MFFWDRCKVHIHVFLPWGFWLKVLKPSGIEPFARPGKAGLMFREAPVPTYIYLSNPYVSIYVHIFLYLSKSAAISIYINLCIVMSWVSIYVYLSTYVFMLFVSSVSIQRPTYILYIYPSLSLPLSLYLCTSLPIYLPTDLLTYLMLPAYLPIHLPTCLPTYLSTYLPTYLPIYLPAYVHGYMQINADIRIYINMCIYIIYTLNLPTYLHSTGTL